MILIQIILVVVPVLILAFVFGSKSSHSVNAWKKLGMIFLASAMVIAVLFPERTNDLARFVGVGRGADLLLYMTVVAFILFVLNDYIHKQKQRDKTFRLARSLALIDAKERYRNALVSEQRGFRKGR